MTKISRQNIDDSAVDASKVDLGDDYDWTGEHDFTAGVVDVATPTADANPLTYGQYLASAVKEPVFVRAQGNVTLSAPGATIDGETMTTDKRVCCDQQTTTSQDGIYLWKGASTPMVRATDFAAGMSVSMAAFGVQKGTDAAKRFEVTNYPGSDVVGTDGLTLRQVSGEPERISNLMSTGLLKGGVITKHGSDPATTIDISAGVGYIVNNYTDPENPVRTRVQWDAFSNVSLDYLSSVSISYIAIDINGAVHQMSSRPATADWRDYIMLGGVGHENHSYITNLSPVTNIAYDIQQQLLEFLEWFGDFKVSGNVMSAYGTDLRVKRSAGSCYKRDGNYWTSAKDLSTIPNAQGNPQLLVGAYRNTSDVFVPTSYTYNLDPNNYDPGGGLGLTSVPSGKWVNHYFFKYAAVDIIVVAQYGQTYYDDKPTALAHLQDGFVPDPDLATCIFLGYITIQQGTTDDSDTDYAVFTPSGKFGLATMISGSSGGEVNTGSNVNTLGIGVCDGKLGVDLQFRGIVADSTKAAVTWHSASKSIGIDIVPGNIAHQDLYGAATNTHAQIDTHIADTTNNVHGVTKTQVGLGSVTNDAQIKASDFPGSATDGQLAQADGTGGKSIKFSSLTGMIKATSGVPAAAISGTDYEPPIAAGTTAQYWRGDKTWQTLPTAPLPKGYKNGLRVSRTTSYLTSRVDIAAGVCRSDDDTTDLVSTGTITVNITAGGANGLDTGSEAANTWYYIWLIYNPGTSTYAGLFSTSSTSPTMPSGYTKKRRVGSVRNNASSNFLAWTQYLGDGNVSKILYDEETSTTIRVLNGGTATSFTDVSLASFIPPTTRLAILGLGYYADGNAEYMMVRKNGISVNPPIYGQWAGTSSLFASSASSSQGEIYTDESQIVEYANSASGGSAYIYVDGYIEEL